MKKILLTILIIITVFWTYEASWAKDKNKGNQKSKRSKRLQEEAEVKGKAAEKDSKIDERRTDERSSRGRDKAEAAKGAVDKGKQEVKAKENVTAKGKEHQQQMKALAKQMASERAKFLRSMARLKRIRELAVKKGETKVVERVDKLMAKAQQIHADKNKRMQDRKQKILQQAEAKPGPDIPKALDRDRGSGKRKAKDDKAAGIEQSETKVKPEDEKVKEEPVKPTVKPGSQGETRKSRKKAS